MSEDIVEFDAEDVIEFDAVVEDSHKSWFAYSTVIGGAVYMMYVGALYITGNLQNYAMSYFQTSQTNVSLLLPTIYFLNSFLIIFFGRYTQRNVQPKLLVSIGATLGLASLLIATNMDSFWLFWAFYCFGFSINTAWAYLVPIHHSWLWFPKNAGLASGICMGGYGLGAFVFDNIMTPIINPDNLAFKDPCSVGANYGCFP